MILSQDPNEDFSGGAAVGEKEKKKSKIVD